MAFLIDTRLIIAIERSGGSPSAWAELQSRGELIGAHDLLIAATALAYDSTVATGNTRHFGRIPALKLAVW